jgi:predicted DNA-binding transcriptional regulator YafY
LQALGDSPHAAILASVVERLSEQLPETVRLAPETLSRMLRFDMGHGVQAPLETMKALHDATRDQRVFRIRYRSNSKDEVTERDVEPYTLVCTQGRWYLIAYCRYRTDMRDFRIDRILSYERIDEVFAIPPDFDLDAYLGPAFGMHRGDRTYPVRIRFSAYQARWIQEEVWHESQFLKRRDDGVLDVMMQVTGLNDVARWVLSYGGEAEVIAPPVLRHRVAVEARRMAKLYENDQPFIPEPTCD